MKALVGFVQKWKYRTEISTGLVLLEPHEVKIMYFFIILFTFSALYGIYLYLPSHLRHLAYLVGIS